MKKKFLTVTFLVLLINMSLFARTTIVHSSYYDDGPNPLFNDIYSSLLFNTTATQDYDAANDDFLLLYGANFSGSVYFMDVPVGVNYSLDLLPIENRTFMMEGMVGLSIRSNTETTQESFFNLGPAFSIVDNSESSLDPYSLVYWGVGLNTGVRVSAANMKYFTMDLGLSGKALWLDSYNSNLPLPTSFTAKDFRYSFSGYIGFTYRWFAPDWSDKDLNVIVAL